MERLERRDGNQRKNMPNEVTRFKKDKSYAGRDVKRTEVRHARTASKGREQRPMRPMRKKVK